MLNLIVKWVTFVYGLLLIALGITGYVMTGSIFSVAVGASMGFLLALCSLLMFMGKRIGLVLATLLTLVMTSCFAYRYSITHALFPATLAVLSGAMLIILLLHFAHWKKG